MVPPQERLSDGVRGSLTEGTAAQPRPNAERRAGRSPEEEERERLSFCCSCLRVTTSRIFILTRTSSSS